MKPVQAAFSTLLLWGVLAGVFCLGWFLLTHYRALFWGGATAVLVFFVLEATYQWFRGGAR